MGKRLMDLIAWLGAALVATGLLIGAPLLLLAAGDGWPGPTSVPTAEQVGEFLTTRLSDENLVAVFVIAGWLLWAHFVFVFVVEFVNQLRDRQSKELHTAAITQRAARFVVTGLFRLGATSTAILGVVGPGASAGAVVMMSTQAGAQELPEGVTIDGDPESENPTTTTTLFGSDDGTSSTFVMSDPNVSARDGKIPYLVAEDDTLWDISERHTGDPQRWREVFDASQGFTQPGADGRVLEHPRLINPGMVLLLPGDAVDVPAVDEALVEAVYGPSSLSTDRVGIGPVGSAPEATTAEVAETEQAVEAAAAEAGASYEDQIGAQTTDAAAVVEAPAESVAPPTSMPAAVVEQPFDSEAEAEIAEASLPAIGLTSSTAAVGFGAGGVIFATFMAMRLRKSKRWTRASKHPGEHPAPLDEDSAELEREVIESSDFEQAEFYGRAWHSLASRKMDADDACQPLLAIRHNDELQVLMSEPSDKVPYPWVCASIEDDAAIWTLPIDPETMQLLPDDVGGAGLPLMVTVGENVFVNLEATGPFGVSGDASRAVGLARSVMWEVAVSPYVDGVDIRMTEAAAARMGLDGGESPAAIDQDVTATTTLVAATMEGHGIANIHVARASRGAESFPTLVVADASDEEHLQGVLLGARELRLPIGVMVLDGRGDAYLAESDAAGNLTLSPSGLRARGAFAEVDRGAMFAELERQRTLLRKVVGSEPVVREVQPVHGREFAEVSVVAGSAPVGSAPTVPVYGDMGDSFEPVASPSLPAEVELPAPPDGSALPADDFDEPSGEALPVYGTFGEDGAPNDVVRNDTAEGDDIDELVIEYVPTVETPDGTMPVTHVGSSETYAADDVGGQGNEPVTEEELAVVQAVPVATDTSTASGEHVPSTDEYEYVSASDVIDIREKAPLLVEDGTLLVRVLGKPEILGKTNGNVSDTVLSFVAFLALEGHQNRDSVKMAMFKKGTAVPDSTWRSLTSRVRAQIPEANYPQLIDASVYRVVSTVTDFDLMMSRLADAETSEDPNERLDAMTEALSLISGEPFGSGRLDDCWDWIDKLASQPRVHLESAVSDAVNKAVTLAVDLGRREEALELIAKGKLANPHGEWLTTTQVRLLIELDRRSSAETIVKAYEAHWRDDFEIEPSSGPREIFETTKAAS